MDPRNLRLLEPHVKPIISLIESIRRRGLKVPNVDPDDGGINAKALFFLTTPGPKAVISGFVSSKNPDPTAANMGMSWEIAGLDRKDIVLWNVVPHCLSTQNESINPTTYDIRESAEDTQNFVNLFTDLRAIVFCGASHTQKAIPFLKFPTGTRVFRTSHTGRMAYNHLRHREAIHETFREVAQLIYKN